MSDALDDPHGRDAALVARVAAGEEGAFEILYHQHYSRVFALAHAVLLDRAEAREVTQEVFVRLYQAAPRWEARARVGTWLYKTCLNIARSARRRLLRFTRAVSLMPAPIAEPSARLEGDAIAEAVRRGLATLPPRQRAVVTLHLDGQLPPREIAKVLSSTPGAVRVNLHRGLARLREQLEAAGVVRADTRSVQEHSHE